MSKIINHMPNAVEQQEMRAAANLLKQDILTLYHGSKEAELTPRYGAGRPNNDYGAGFYTTPDIELAKEWAYSSYTKGNQGYLHTFRLQKDGLKILDLTQHDSLHWIAELLSHREINLEGREALRDIRDAFIQKYKLNTDDYDVIIGYRADDSYFSYAVDFLQSAIYKDTLENALRYGHLGLQVFIKSEKAFAQLEKMAVEAVPLKYARFYEERDQDAREKYSVQRKRERNTVSRKRQTIHDFV